MKSSNVRLFRAVLLFGATIVLISSAATEARGWDGRRKGFILGLGIGSGNSHSMYRLRSRWSESQVDSEKPALITNFRLGYAPADKVLFYWVSKVSWFSFDGEYHSNTLGGLGTSYYLKSQSPSVFFTGGIGVSSWGPAGGDPQDRLGGFGISAGAGYEFADYWSIEMDVTWGDLQASRREAQTSVSALSVQLTLNVLGY